MAEATVLCVCLIGRETTSKVGICMGLAGAQEGPSWRQVPDRRQPSRCPHPPVPAADGLLVVDEQSWDACTWDDYKLMGWHWIHFGRGGGGF